MTPAAALARHAERLGNRFAAWLLARRIRRRRYAYAKYVEELTREPWRWVYPYLQWERVTFGDNLDPHRYDA